jgi:hypothetical protein
MAYQFAKAESKDGIVLVFRRPTCNINTLNVKLKSLEPKVMYEIYYEDYNISINQIGEKLMQEGLDVKIADAPGSLLILYKQLNRD